MDKARRWTDQELAKMEKQLKTHYSQAKKEMQSKWDDFVKTETKEIKKLKADITAAEKAAADPETIKRLKKKLQKLNYDFTLGNRYYKAMIKDMTSRLADVNAAAVDMLNGRMPSIYAVNYNYSLDEVAAQTGISFSMVDKNTVARMIKDGDIQLPPRKLNIPKDMQWNTKKLNSAVLQGILQGESMDEIAKRILPIIDGNYKSAIRNARTMVTGAESRGRIDSYKQMTDRGIVMNKVWMANLDSKVRDWHAEMNGQEVRVGEMFIDGLGNELFYPGDPGAPGETVYNCRCTMKSHIIGFRKANGRIEYV